MRRVVSLLLCLPLLTGCAGLFDREFYEVRPHLDEPAAEAESPDSLRASNQRELQAAILQLVRAHAEEGTVRLVGYTGDVQRDLSLSNSNVSAREPLGAYAVSSIQSERIPLLTETEVNFVITYRRTVEQTENIISASGQSSLQAEVGRAMSAFQTELVVETTYYDRDLMDLEAMARTRYYQNPRYAVGLPGIRFTLYPGDADSVPASLRRIIEIAFEYPYDAEEMNRRAAACERSANILLGPAPASLPPAGLAMWIHDRLRDEIRYDAYTARSHEESGGSLPHNDSYTLYGALENGLAVGEGYALAYKRLCDAFGIPCEVVVGLRGGAEHAWNVVQLVGDWYHVDAAGNDQDGDPLEYRWFLKTDVAMQEEYRYQSAQIPACDSGGLTFEVVAERYFPDRYARWLDEQLTIDNGQLTINNEEDEQLTMDNGQLTIGEDGETVEGTTEEPGEEPPGEDEPTGEEEPAGDEEPPDSP